MFIQSLIALCIAVSSLAFVYPVRSFAASRLEPMLGDLLKPVEALLEGYISYESLSPRLVNRIDIRNVSYQGHGASLRAERAVITYPFRELLETRSVSSLDVHISGVSSSADLDRLLPQLQALTDQSAESKFPLTSVHFRLEDAQTRLKYQDYSAVSSFDSFHLHYGADPAFLSGAFSGFSASVSGPVDGSISAADESRFSWSRDSASVQINDLAADLPDYGSVENIPLLMILEDDQLYTSLHTPQVSLLLNYALGPGTFQLTASSDEFTPGEDWPVYYEHEIIDRVKDIEELNFSVTVDGRLSEDQTLEQIAYSGSVRLPEYTYDELTVSYLQSTFSGDLQEIAFDTLQGRIHDIPLRFSGRFSMEHLAPTGSLDIRPPESLYDEDISITLEGTGDRSLLASFEHQQFDLQAEVFYANLEFVGIETSVQAYGISYDIPLVFEPFSQYLRTAEGADIIGSLDFSQEQMNFFLRWDMLPLPVEQEQLSRVPFSGHIVGTGTSLDDYRISINRLQAHGITLEGHSFDLTLKANITPDFANIVGLTYEDEFGELTASGSVFFDIAQQVIRSGSLEFVEDDESYAVSFTNYDGFYHGSVQISSGDLERYPFLSSRGEMEGSLVFYGVPGNFNFDIDLFFPNLVYRDNYYTGNLSAILDNSGLTVTDSSFTMENITFDEISAEYDFLDGSLDLSLDLVFDAGYTDFSTRVNARSELPRIEQLRQLADVSGLLNHSEFDVELLDFGFSNVLLSEQMDLHIEVIDREVFITESDREERFTMYIDNQRREFEMTLGEDLPLQFDSDGSWEGDGMFTFNARNLLFDVTFLNLIGIPELEFVSGIAAGYMMVTGNVQDPDFYGELNTDELKVDLNYIPDTLRANNVSMTVHGKEMNFTKFNTMVDGVPVRTKMDFYVERWIPQYFDMRFEVPQGRSIPSSYTFPQPMLTYDAQVSGWMTLEIDTTGTHIEGDLFVDDAVVSMITDEYVPPDEILLVTGDLQITTGRSVQFRLPTMEFPILTANAEPQQSVHIEFHTVNNTFLIAGNIDLRSGEIYYVRRNFYITEGSIRLAETEDQVDPLISVRARIREYDRQANRVDIYLVADNQRLSDLNPRFESNPPLPINEIAEILGESLFISEQPGGRGALSPAFAIASLATDIIYQFGLIEQLTFNADIERGIRNALGLDVFSLRTQLVHNIMLANLTDHRTAAHPIASYLDNTTMFLGKYLGDSMFFQTMLVLSENTAGDAGLFFTDDLQMDMEFSFEWETPLYDLTISTQPQLSFPEIFSDFSVGLSWRYSF